MFVSTALGGGAYYLVVTVYENPRMYLYFRRAQHLARLLKSEEYKLSTCILPCG